MKRLGTAWIKPVVVGFFISLVLVIGCKKEAKEEEGDPYKTLPTSLHGTAYGMKYWYEVASPEGLFQFTHIPYDSLACKNCHIDVNDDGCTKCHENPGDKPTSDKCYACHGREAKEKMFYTDFHRDNQGMECADCHTEREVHGDGNSYDSYLAEGAMDTKCTNCHDPDNLPENPSHNQHLDEIDCSACHTQSVISCYSCHFESEVDYGVKLANGILKDWTFLLNYNGKVHAGIIMTITYQGNTFLAIAPYTSHTITPQGRTCDDCHGSDAVNQYKQNHMINAVWWNADSGKLENLKGVIPIPYDYNTSLKFAFVKCVSGCDNPETAQWEFLKNGADAIQMLYGTPLTAEQMQNLMNFGK